MRHEYKTAHGVSIKELRAACQATAPDPERETWVGWFARRFAIYFTKLFLYTPITPNQITVISTAVFFAGIGLYFIDDIAVRVVGALLVFFSVVIDGCDGEVARFRKAGSPVGGGYVEPVSHDIQYGLAFLLLAIALFIHSANPWIIVVGAFAGIVKLSTRLLELRFWKVRNQELSDAPKAKQSAQARAPWYRRALSWLKRNIFASAALPLPLLLFTLFDRVDLFILLFALGFGLAWLYTFAKHVVNITKGRLIAAAPEVE